MSFLALAVHPFGELPLHRRRAEDHVLRLVVGGPEEPETVPPARGGEGLQWSIYEWTGGSAPSPTQIGDLKADSDGRVLLLDFGGDEAILIAGASIRRIPMGVDREDLLERARRGAASWERERERIWRWLRLPDLLNDFADQLNHAEQITDVSRVVENGVATIVGGFRALLLLREPGSESMYSREASLRCVNGVSEGFTLAAHPRLWKPGLVRAADASAQIGGPFAALSELFSDTDAATVVHVPVGPEGILLLVERRSQRTFDGDDWGLLRNIASQAEGAIQRVRSLEEVRQLSLTDPLTGLANRRRLNFTMQHAWASAKRGRSLSVALLDLDHFKRINDEQGHLAGDRILRTFAAVLQEQARETDLVVRYGGDEFLILLEGEASPGAGALIQRIQRRLGNQVLFSAGVAEYRDGMSSPEELFEEADRALYAVKRLLRSP